ncbi:MAG: HlyC/CorC family transporter [Clostridia bacterium]|nr:HlyC/CorC family transporter [Clostridia bacterium]
MDSSSIGEIVALIILVFCSGYFSATETAFSSLNHIKIKNMADDGNKRAKLVEKMLNNYDRLLSTILVGNNIVNITSASIATVLFVRYFQDAGVTLSTLVMTIVILIFGEVSPKSLAKDFAEEFAMFSAPILNFLTILLTPVNFLFEQWRKLLNKVFHLKADNSITEEELLTIVKEAEDDGELNEQESELIQNAIEFSEVEASDVLTPRVDLIAISKDEDNEEIMKLFFESGFSRLPVYENTIDTIIGFINEKDFNHYVIREKKPLEKIINPVQFVSPTIKVSRLLNILQKSKCHMAIVTDEYGGTMGIVTLEDILEELVGEIWDEHDKVVSEIDKVSDNEYYMAGGLNLDKMFEFFEMKNEFEDITTVSGWIIEQLGKIPEEGDSFEYENLVVKVEKKDIRRIIKVKITVKEPIAVEE